jgi:hypothetical protein
MVVILLPRSISHLHIHRRAGYSSPMTVEGEKGSERSLTPPQAGYQGVFPANKHLPEKQFTVNNFQ